MKKILLMRHAEAVPGAPDLSDYHRPLSKSGKKTAQKMGLLLKQNQIAPDKIITSTAHRTKETASFLLEGLGSTIEIYPTQKLYQAGPKKYLTILSEMLEEIDLPMLIGHNPGIGNFLELRCRKHTPMRTATIAAVRFNISSWNELNDHTPGKLENIWHPTRVL